MPQPQPGTASFYREQAERLGFLAAETMNAETRLELLEIAASFQKLADYASINDHIAERNEKIVRRA